MIDTTASRTLTFPATPLALAHLLPVAEGRDRKVYFCESFPQILFKSPKSLHSVLNIDEGTKPKLAMADLRNFRSLILKLAPSTLWHPFRKENECYFNARIRSTSIADLPIPAIYGFFDSDMGPVLAVERIALNNELLGSTFSTLSQTKPVGFELVNLLNIFAERMFRHEIIAGDMNMNNIVLGERGGEKQLILIDGFGDIKPIPIRSASPSVNRRYLIRSFRKIARRTDLEFDSKDLKFSGKTS